MILHVTTEKEWRACANMNSFAPASFESLGFIHACSSQQLSGVLQRYFAGQTDLLLLYILEEKLTCQLKYEQATGNELFPHIYGRIDKKAIIQVKDLKATP